MTVRPLVPLRLFLGGTFLYAGLDKLAGGTFLRATGLGSIGASMGGYVGHSPLGPLVALALPWAVAVGWAIAIAEVAVGLGLLTGVAHRPAALAAAGLGVLLWLTASWEVTPFYLGPDLPVAAGCLALALATRDELAYPWTPEARAAAARLLPVALLATAWAALGGFRGGVPGVVGTPSPSPAPSAAGEPSAAPSPGETAFGLEVARVADVPVDASVAFEDPTTGAAGVLVHLPDGTFVAYDPTCPHAGCTVGFDAASGMLVCPCHSATFDPADHGHRVSGPTFRSLLEYPIHIDAATGAITVRI